MNVSSSKGKVGQSENGWDGVAVMVCCFGEARCSVVRLLRLFHLVGRAR
jgi:hypothetical protein